MVSHEKMRVLGRHGVGFETCNASAHEAAVCFALVTSKCYLPAVMLRSACLAALCITASGFSGTAPGAFSSPARAEVSVRARSSCSSLAMVAAGKPGAKINVKAGDFDINKPTKRVGEEPVVKEVIPPPKIETECDADYGPLLKALQDGEWEEADQLTRDMLIWIGGPAMRKRNFVYFAEVPRLPLKDMRTIDNLWTTYSKGKFGYSVQRQIWNSKKVLPEHVALLISCKKNVVWCRLLAGVD